MDITAINAMNKISYGLYVLTTKCASQVNGCIINTLQQVTSSPNRVSIAVNKGNYTEYMIRQSGVFNVSVLDESAGFGTFTHFGFATGRWGNKFYNYSFETSANGVPYIKEGACAYLSCKVVQTVDLGTHTLFIADVRDGEVLSDKAAMTYAYYHANVKRKPAAAPAKNTAVGERWICNICGYIYEGPLPEDFVCPICKHGAADFSRIDENGNIIENIGEKAETKPADGDNGNSTEKWVCTVCGYVYEGPLPEDFECPVCGVGPESFQRE